MDCASVGSGFFGIVVPPPGGGRSQSFTSMLCSQGLDFSVADGTGALPEESGHRRDVSGVRWGSTTTEEDAEACNKIISDYRRRRRLQASNYRDERYATVWASRVHWRSPSFEEIVGQNKRPSFQGLSFVRKAAFRDAGQPCSREYRWPLVSRFTAAFLFPIWVVNSRVLLWAEPCLKTSLSRG